MVTPAELVEAAVKANVDLIAVTDHDTMACVKEVQQRGEGAGLIVVPGQEVTTKWPATRHVLAWFLDKPIKRGMSLEDTVAAIHDQDGLAIIPHPFMPVYFGSIQPHMLRRLLERHHVDGIEMMSTVPIGKRRRRELSAFYAHNRERLRAAVAGSDRHFRSRDMGPGLAAHEGDLRAPVQLRTTRPPAGARPGDNPARAARRPPR